MTDLALTGKPTIEAGHGVLLTEAAASKVKSLLAQEGRDDLRLRLAVQPGGCSGLIYQLYFDERLIDGDATVDFDGVEVVVDRMSVPYLTEATVDFVDTLEQSGSAQNLVHVCSSIARGCEPRHSQAGV